MTNRKQRNHPGHKFRAKPQVLDGYRFPSKKEGKYYLELKNRVKSGEVVFFLMQVPLQIQHDMKYIVDFVEFRSDGTVHFIDVKGYETKEFKLKKKLVEQKYPIEVEVV